MTPISPDKTYQISEDVVVREIDGEVIIVPLTSGIGDMEDELYTVNQTGKVICEKLDGKRPLREVIRGISEDFEAPQGEIEEDVTGFLSELLKRGMIVEVPGA